MTEHPNQSSKIDRMEAFFNTLSDQRWMWYPFARLKPQPTEPITPARLVAAVLAYGYLIAVMAFLGFCLMSALLRQGPYLVQHPELVFLAFLQAVNYTTTNYWAAFLIGFPVYVALAWIPSVVSWNRRARRLLSYSPEHAETGNAEHSPQEWPPPPTKS
jgi:hypothetical protein